MLIRLPTENLTISHHINYYTHFSYIYLYIPVQVCVKADTMIMYYQQINMSPAAETTVKAMLLYKRNHYLLTNQNFQQGCGIKKAQLTKYNKSNNLKKKSISVLLSYLKVGLACCVTGESDCVCLLSVTGHLFHVIRGVLVQLAVTEAAFCHWVDVNLCISPVA